MAQDVFAFIDGTKCSYVTKTNIQKIHDLSQKAGYPSKYQEGIGLVTRTPHFDQLLAPNLEPEAYKIYIRLLDLNLTSDDRIYIFGYSRGAVVARVLAKAIVSSSSLTAMVGRNVAPPAIMAKVQFLGLIEPVAGWPRFNRRKVKDHDAVFDPKIKNYLELIALNETRKTFSSDSYSASKNARLGVEGHPSKASFQTTKDRAADVDGLLISKSRKCVWFPGHHSDVGGEEADSSIGKHARMTMIEEVLASSNRGGAPVNFVKHDLMSIWNENVLGSYRRTSQVKAFWAGLRKLISLPGRNRGVTLGNHVQHLRHPICHYEHPNKIRNIGKTNECLEYPDYPEIRKKLGIRNLS